MHRKVAGMVAVVLTLGVLSCGGGEKPLTKAEFTRQATALCVRSRQPLKRIAPGHAAMLKVAKRALANHRALVVKLDAITPPDDLAASYDDYISALRTQDGLSQKILDGVVAGSDSAIGAGGALAGFAHDRNVAAHKAYKISNALGISTCGG